MRIRKRNPGRVDDKTPRTVEAGLVKSIHFESATEAGAHDRNATSERCVPASLLTRFPNGAAERYVQAWVDKGGIHN